MSILIGSDLVPTNVNLDEFNKGDVKKILGEDLYDIWNSAKHRIFNLETPLLNKQMPIKKQGPNLIAPTSTIKGIIGFKPSLITLANNHILDHGVEGLKSTLGLLDYNNVNYIGAGNNLIDASKPYVFEYCQQTVGVYTCAEHEFTIATTDHPGANPFDPLESLDHISFLKSKCDFVIVLYHGGKEHYRYPSPLLQKVCHKISEKGADLVVCQHSHCVGSFEKYKGSTIIYGQGNFVFNRHNKHDNEYWNNSLLIKIDDKFNIDYIPIVTNEVGVNLAPNKQRKEILDGFYSRSEQILERDFIEEEYKRFAEEKLRGYLRKLAGFGKWKNRIDNRIFNGKLSETKYKEQNLLAIQNYIECEAHRELLLEGIKLLNESK